MATNADSELLPGVSDRSDDIASSAAVGDVIRHVRPRIEDALSPGVAVETTVGSSDSVVRELDTEFAQLLPEVGRSVDSAKQLADVRVHSRSIRSRNKRTGIPVSLKLGYLSQHTSPPPNPRVSVERHSLPLDPVSVSFRPQTLLWLSRLLSCYPRSPATCILLVSRPDLFSAAVRTAATDRSPPLLQSFHTLLSNHILSGCRFVVLRSRRMLCICTLPLVYPFCYRVHPGSLTKVINSFSGT